MVNKNKFLFSIVTPVKNGSRYIARYLNCLYKQTYQNWEAIIIDDGSCDNTMNILKSATFKDRRFKIIKNRKQKIIDSPYYARNIGIDMAKGTYICFLDIDDLWLPNKLLRQYQIISENRDLNLIFSSYYRFSESNNNFFIRRPFTFLGIKNIIHFLNPVPMLSSCVKADKILNIRFKPQYHEDYLFWKELIKNIRSDSVYVDYKLHCIYNVSNSSLSNNKIKITRWIWDIYFFENKNYFISFIKIIFRAFLQLLIYLLDKKVKINSKYLIN